MKEPCTSQEKGERGDNADKSWHGAFPFPGGLSSIIAIGFRTTNKVIIRVEHSEGWRVIKFLHLRATEALGVGPGFELRFGYCGFTAAITILAAVDLVLGHGLSGDFGVGRAKGV